MNLDARLREILPPELYELPVPFVPRQRPVSHLEPGERGALEQRRRDDCALLGACELSWIEEHGEEQARCPGRCAWFTRAA